MHEHVANRSFSFSDLSPAQEFCKQVTEPNTTDELLLGQIYAGLSIYLNYTGDMSCVDLAEDPTDLGAEAWNFQVCTELFLPICAKGGANDFFEPSAINLTEYTANCVKQYGVRPEFNKVDQQFGVQQLQGTSRIIFSNGERDPWATGGYRRLPDQRPLQKFKYFVVDYDRFPELRGNLQVAGDQIFLVNLPHACHHEDLRAHEPLDPPLLGAVRLQELKIITVWTHQFYLDETHLPNDWLIRFQQIMDM